MPSREFLQAVQSRYIAALCAACVVIVLFVAILSREYPPYRPCSHNSLTFLCDHRSKCSACYERTVTRIIRQTPVSPHHQGVEAVRFMPTDLRAVASAFGPREFEVHATLYGCDWRGRPGILLCERGQPWAPTFEQLVLEVQSEGHGGVIVSNDRKSRTLLRMGSSFQRTTLIPAVFISKQLGDLLRARLPLDVTMISNHRGTVLRFNAALSPIRVDQRPTPLRSLGIFSADDATITRWIEAALSAPLVGTWSPEETLQVRNLFDQARNATAPVALLYNDLLGMRPLLFDQFHRMVVALEGGIIHLDATHNITASDSAFSAALEALTHNP